MKKILLVMFSILLSTELFAWNFKDIEMSPKYFEFEDYELSYVFRDGKGNKIGSRYEKLETKEDALYYQRSEYESGDISKTEEVRFKASDIFSVDQLLNGKSRLYGSTKTIFTYNSDGLLIEEVEKNKDDIVEQKIEIENSDNRLKKRTFVSPTGNTWREEFYTYDDVAGMCRIDVKEVTNSFPRNSYYIYLYDHSNSSVLPIVSYRIENYDLSVYKTTGQCSQSEYFLECHKLETIESPNEGRSNRFLNERYILIRERYFLNGRSFYFSTALPLETLKMDQDGTILSSEKFEYNDSYAPTSVTIEEGGKVTRKELTEYNQAGLQIKESIYELDEPLQSLQLKTQKTFQYDDSNQHVIGEKYYQWDKISNEMKLVKSVSIE